MQVLKRIIVAILTIEARLVLLRYRPQIIAVTGSVGKTSTKDAIYTVVADDHFVRKSQKSFKVTTAYSIFQICNDQEMIDLVLKELPKITSQYELIDVVYMLPAFKNEKITALLNNYRNHKEYLVAYNATRALGLSTDEVVNKARQQNEKKSFWKKLFG